MKKVRVADFRSTTSNVKITGFRINLQTREMVTETKLIPEKLLCWGIQIHNESLMHRNVQYLDRSKSLPWPIQLSATLCLPLLPEIQLFTLGKHY
jgi:hypothetical protein